jgi:hypothetical protein
MIVSNSSALLQLTPSLTPTESYLLSIFSKWHCMAQSSVIGYYGYIQSASKLTAELQY